MAVKAISLNLESVQYEQLHRMSSASRRPITQIILDAIDAYLQRPATKPGQEWFWTKEWQAAEREAEADLAAGRFETFENDADFLASLV